MKWVCPTCSSNDFRFFLKGKRGTDNLLYDLIECANCKMISVNPMPSDQYLNNYYSLEYNGRVKKNIIPSQDLIANEAAIEDCYKKLKYISKFAHVKNGKLLDIGCGHGFFAYASKNLGFNASGLDIDRDAIKWGRETLNIKIIEQPIENMGTLEHNSYDIITFWQVLEHLKNPLQSLKHAYDLIIPGGIVAGSVPNIDGIGYKFQKERWYLLLPPEHLCYFNDSSLKNTIMCAGFDIVFIGTVPLYATPYFSLGIRGRLMKFAHHTDQKILKSAVIKLHRLLTLVKRHIIFAPINNVIMLLKIKGNSLFFIAKKASHSEQFIQKH